MFRCSQLAAGYYRGTLIPSADKCRWRDKLSPRRRLYNDGNHLMGYGGCSLFFLILFSEFHFSEIKGLLFWTMILVTKWIVLAKCYALTLQKCNLCFTCKKDFIDFIEYSDFVKTKKSILYIILLSLFVKWPLNNFFFFLTHRTGIVFRLPYLSRLHDSCLSFSLNCHFKFFQVFYTKFHTGCVQPKSLSWCG